jgi:hypothetical protein
MHEEQNRRLARLVPGLARRYGSCERKVPYLTLEEVLAMRERRQAQAGIFLAYYRCPQGEHYHLTRQPPTPAQVAELNADFRQHFHGMEAELQAYPARWEALMRKAEATHRALERGPRRLARLQPSPRIIPQLITYYRQQRDDWIHLGELVEQITDLTLRRDLILARSEAVLAHRDDIGAGMQAWRVRGEELRTAAEDSRQELLAGLDRQLAALERDHAKNLARARTYLNTHYRLPAFPPDALQ